MEVGSGTMPNGEGGRGGDLAWGVFVVVVLAAFGAWTVYRVSHWDGDIASYMAVVSRHRPALDDAVTAIHSCGPEIRSCRDALRSLRTAARSYEDDLSRHPAPCDDEASRELWWALNDYLAAVADAEADLDRRHGPVSGASFAAAEARQSRADALLSANGVCREVPSAGDTGG
jgi:hypothetical protein